ncbi:MULTISPECIES: DUF1868 domain-containing protein [unclassified Agrobacterium]|uniref:DUF1868 domain-containing protein n=1 Tax=unclassified Agrobacterium TaxID=2632611 RepID=UPI00244705A0|nr:MULTISPECIES: DUF1868 domain-containing protein [unclassified Agrobacterium]MDH0612650.1 DUF1868 domain-containing protein [Agrobacterium sp. GD03872]MDH0699450.1 DUF1868 domain-containing protein [Agrobacterium sp. GD03871]MDH1062327.1 DUF1868 domain-containing protein [Agrobacterium sp. GD03992]MDH2209376.1 DUF1868 domain-containing protein [Agrobacterium sp. GD03643]MDH2221817.1 DUF1868 domain-containing protein [Agrobacterium sp. GD03638]
MHAPRVSKDIDYISAANHDQPPRHLGSRFNADGEFLPEPGNTVVCHLVEGSQTEKAIIATRQRFLDMPEASQLAFTPVSSLHMTVFQGIIEFRRALPYWPENMPLDTPINMMTDYYRDRLSAFPALPAFNMQVTGLRPAGLVMKGATAEDDRIVALWRDTFADLFGYRHPDHDTYEFHITLSYIISWFAPECLPRWQAMLDEELEKLRAAAPVIEMRPPAFCEFRDMNHFKELIAFDKI